MQDTTKSKGGRPRPRKLRAFKIIFHSIETIFLDWKIRRKEKRRRREGKGASQVHPAPFVKSQISHWYTETPYTNEVGLMAYKPTVYARLHNSETFNGRCDMILSVIKNTSKHTKRVQHNTTVYSSKPCSCRRASCSWTSRTFIRLSCSAMNASCWRRCMANFSL